MDNSKSKEFNIINNNIKKLEKTITINTNYELSNQLVNQIIEKDKKIDELDKELNEILEENTCKQKIKGKNIIINNNNNNYNELNELDNKPFNLILNNQTIQFRETDNYINATQLCKAGEKKFNDWLRLDTTKKLINVLACEAGIPASQLIDTIVIKQDFRKKLNLIK